MRAQLSPGAGSLRSCRPIPGWLVFAHCNSVATAGRLCFLKVGASTSEPRFWHPPRPTGLRLLTLGGKKACKTKYIKYLPVPSGCAARNLGCSRNSVVHPGHQLGDLRLSPEGREERPAAPPANRPLAPRAPASAPGEIRGALPSSPCAPASRAS